MCIVHKWNMQRIYETVRNKLLLYFFLKFSVAIFIELLFIFSINHNEYFTYKFQHSDAQCMTYLKNKKSNALVLIIININQIDV